MAFRLSDDGQLIGIENFPHLDWNDLIGYAAQKEKLMANTAAFVSGKEANNVLLTGSRGTGKSTAVKALVSRYHEQGLRLVQLQRDQLQGLQPLMEKLGAIGSKRFILFLDDLSFDENEASYKYLKSAMDGGVTPQPQNVVIYATSNRRHLLKETWHDRMMNGKKSTVTITPMKPFLYQTVSASSFITQRRRRMNIWKSLAMN